LKTTFTDQHTPANDDVCGEIADLQPEALPEESASAVVRWLDRTIVVLMVAILLTLSWPVSVALWSARRPAAMNFTQRDSNAVERGVYSP
jgi:hypothetical protein